MWVLPWVLVGGIPESRADGVLRVTGKEQMTDLSLQITRKGGPTGKALFKPSSASLPIVCLSPQGGGPCKPMALVSGEIQYPVSEMLVEVSPVVDFSTKDRRTVTFLVEVPPQKKPRLLVITRIDKDGALWDEFFEVSPSDQPDRLRALADAPPLKRELPQEPEIKLKGEIQLVYRHLDYSQSDLAGALKGGFPGLRIYESWMTREWRLRAGGGVVLGSFDGISDGVKLYEGEFMASRQKGLSLGERSWIFSAGLGFAVQTFVTTAPDFGYSDLKALTLEIGGATPVRNGNHLVECRISRSAIFSRGFSGETRISALFRPSDDRRGFGGGLEWSSLSFNSGGVGVSLSRFGLNLLYDF
ncbi:MAG: hypothetical protein EBX52_00485 [Proteobacteria bacterium]|nr:hypothetical protein [Pseudomonadota bacterium]